MIRIDIDDAGAKALLADLTNGPAITRAWRRATKKSADWVVGQIAKRLSARTGIPQKVFRQRRLKQRASTDGRVVWFGTLPIPASRLGAVRQTKTGAAAGRFRFPGAFVRTMPSGHVGIFERKAQLERKSRGAWSKNLPIFEPSQAIPMAEAEARAVQAEAGDILATKTRQELNYELNVRN